MICKSIKNEPDIAFDGNFFSGFELKKQNNTMCVITQPDILTVSFQAAEILTMWETWIYHTCFRGYYLSLSHSTLPKNFRYYCALMIFVFQF